MQAISQVIHRFFAGRPGTVVPIFATTTLALTVITRGANSRSDRYFIRSNVFCSSSRSLAFPTFSRVLSIHFFSNAFLVARSLW